MILLFYMQEKSVDEIAQISGMTTSNVKTKLFRTRKKLLNMMKEPDEKEHEYKYE
jgi:RNA polymerase sigma-70 factor (ECF subfamily)